MKETFGSVNLTIVCAGQVMQPGDVIVADDDGVCVVRREEAPQVLAAANARLLAEAALRQRLARGESSLDLFNLRDHLAAKGLRYV